MRETHILQRINFEKAIDYFKLSNSNESEENSFLTGSNNFKIGLASSDDTMVIEHLERSATIFENIDNYDYSARSYGALGAHYLKNGEFLKAIEIGEKLTNWYYVENRNETRSSVKLLFSQIQQLLGKARGNSLSVDNQCLVPIDKKLYLTVEKDLRFEAGGAVTLNLLSELAKYAGYFDKQKELLKRGLKEKIVFPLDRDVIMLNWVSLYSSTTVDEFDENEFSSLFQEIIQCQPAPGAKNEKIFIFANSTTIYNKRKKRHSKLEPYFN